MDVVPGAKAPFKVIFASKVIGTMKLVRSDVTILLTSAVRSEQRIKEHDQLIKRNPLLFLQHWQRVVHIFHCRCDEHVCV